MMAVICIFHCNISYRSERRVRGARVNSRVDEECPMSRNSGGHVFSPTIYLFIEKCKELSHIITCEDDRSMAENYTLGRDVTNPRLVMKRITIL